MVKFRRSMKSDKEGKPLHISIQPKDAIAIVPPKKVIKALYDYQAPDPSPNSGYLSFSQGDFLHVVGRENDTDWYEACNPLIGTRGLVPVTYFDTVGKTVRDSGSSSRSVPLPSASHDSGYAERPPNTATSITSAGLEPEPKSARLSKTLAQRAGGTGAMVYGVVMYDFKAERPDELEAKEGEAIIVIAQSNPEWFVAKPITRLGGPGLIPVSFIEIRDMASGQAVPDPHEAVRRAGVPKVEEWKKMAADYKNGSIPLGKLEANSAQSLEQGLQRMSMSNKGQPGNGYMSGTTLGPTHSRASSTTFNQPPSAQYRGSSEPLLAPLSAHVPRYCFADDIFWFVIECQMEDGRHWELSRLYQDFYDLQINLIQEFPYEAGNVPGVERSLPYMPGPVTYVTDNISNGRRANLDEYIQQLLRLGQHISKGRLVREFFKPRTGDYEIDPNVVQDQYRMSSASQQSASDPSQGASRQSSAGNLNGNVTSPAYSGNPYGHQRAQASVSSQGPQHYRTQSDMPPPGMPRQGSALTQASTASAPMGSGAPAIKIKVWFEEDNCVVIRLPPNFKYADLYKKLSERHAMEKPDEPADQDLLVEYRDEVEGTFYRIENDDDLAVALERNPKLTLSVATMR